MGTLSSQIRIPSLEKTKWRHERFQFSNISPECIFLAEYFILQRNHLPNHLNEISVIVKTPEWAEHWICRLKSWFNDSKESRGSEQLIQEQTDTFKTSPLDDYISSLNTFVLKSTFKAKLCSMRYIWLVKTFKNHLE